ncbi:ferritin family protein [Chloroflexota bacterium]
MTTAGHDPAEALQTAIQMEIDGKEFYTKASQNSSNELGKKLLQTLAEEEDTHRLKFEEIYRAIQNKESWPETDFKPDGGQRLRTIFSRAIAEISSSVEPPATELDAVQTAMGLENKTRDFYLSQAESSTSNVAREFYETVAAEEKEHHLVLLDYYEYLKDPSGWFVSKEHPSLDGG